MKSYKDALSGNWLYHAPSIQEGRDASDKEKMQMRRRNVLAGRTVFGLEGAAYDQATAEREYGPLITERRISPYEQAYIFERATCVVWTEGYRAGDIYRIIPRGDEAQGMPVSYERFEAAILQALEEIEELNQQQQELIKAKDYPGVKALSPLIDQKTADLLVDIHRFYDGGQQWRGLEAAELFDEDLGKYETFLQEVEEEGIKRWLGKKSTQLGLKHVSFMTSSGGEMRALNKYYYGKESTSDNYHESEQDPIVLRHGTYSHALTNIIQMGGLASRDSYGYFDIKKRFGGEGGSSFSYTPKNVSFWRENEARAQIAGGYGSQQGFEYPMMFGISKRNLDQVRLAKGTMQNEEVTSLFVSLKTITHVFVPSFKVEEVQEIFLQHGWKHIKVAPLGRA